MGEKDHGDPLTLAVTAKGKRRDCSEITCYRCREKGHYCSECRQENLEKPKKPSSGVLL
jgi:hypothetical protein